MLELTDTDNQRVIIRPCRISAIQEGDGCTIVRLAGNFIVVKEPVAEVREKWEKALQRVVVAQQSPMRNPITGRTDDPVPPQVPPLGYTPDSISRGHESIADDSVHDGPCRHPEAPRCNCLETPHNPQCPAYKASWGPVVDAGTSWPSAPPCSWAEVTECLRRLYCIADRLVYAGRVRQVDKHS